MPWDEMNRRRGFQEVMKEDNSAKIWSSLTANVKRMYVWAALKADT